MYQYFNTSTSLTTFQFLDFIPSLQTQHDSIANVSVCCLWFIYCRAVPTLTTTQSKQPQPRKQLTHSDMQGTSGRIPQTLLVRVWVHETIPLQVYALFSFRVQYFVAMVALVELKPTTKDTGGAQGYESYGLENCCRAFTIFSRTGPLLIPLSLRRSLNLNPSV